MSVQSEIDKITTNRDAVSQEIRNKGVDVPQGAPLADLPNYIKLLPNNEEMLVIEAKLGAYTSSSTGEVLAKTLTITSPSHIEDIFTWYEEHNQGKIIVKNPIYSSLLEDSNNIGISYNANLNYIHDDISLPLEKGKKVFEITIQEKNNYTIYRFDATTGSTTIGADYRIDSTPLEVNISYNSQTKEMTLSKTPTEIINWKKQSPENIIRLIGNTSIQENSTAQYTDTSLDMMTDNSFSIRMSKSATEFIYATFPMGDIKTAAAQEIIFSTKIKGQAEDTYRDGEVNLTQKDLGIWTGTKAEYETALAAGEIKEDSVINITDDFEDSGGGSSSGEEDTEKSQYGYSELTPPSEAYSVNLNANTLYNIITPVSELNITFEPLTKAYAEYLFIFRTAATGCTLNLPGTVAWNGDKIPVIEGNKKYEVSILNDIAVISGGIAL